MASKLRLLKVMAETPVVPAGTGTVVEVLVVTAMPPKVTQPDMSTSAAVAIPVIANAAKAAMGFRRVKNAIMKGGAPN